MKKLLSLLLALALTVGLLPALPALAADVMYPTNENGLIMYPIDPENFDPENIPEWGYSHILFDPETREICGTSHKGIGSVVIPETINGIPVEGIASGCFEYCHNDGYGLKWIKLPEKPIKIGYGAFYWCNDLDVNRMAEENENWSTDGVCLFYDYTDEAGNQQRRLVHVQNGSYDGVYAIPEGVTEIDDGGFSLERDSVDGLTGVTLPNTLKKIGNCAFNYAENTLTSIVIPASVEEMGHGIFNNTELREIRFLGDAPKFQTYSNGDYDGPILIGPSVQEESTRLYYPASNPTWAEDVRPDFKYDRITWIAVYELLEGENAEFMLGGEAPVMRVDCEVESFVSVAVDGELVAGENYAVSSGSTILEFTEDYLNTLAVGEHQVEMTFTDGVAYSTLTVKETDPDWYEIEGGEVLFSKETGTILEANEYSGSSSYLVIPEKIDGVTVRKIADNAFAYSGLEWVKFPENVEIGSGIFAQCTELDHARMAEENAAWTTDGLCLFYDYTGENGKRQRRLVCVDRSREEPIGDYAIAEGVTEIDDDAFCYDLRDPREDTLTGITFPSTLTKIGSGAFYRCYGLTAIEIPGSVKEIGEMAFAKYIYDEMEGLESVILPEGVERVAGDAFLDDALDYLEIPASVKEIYGFTSVTAKEIRFLGSMPKLADEILVSETADGHTIYYPGNDPTWAEELRPELEGVVWVAEYPVLEGENAEFTIGGEAPAIRVDCEVEKFVSVAVDGVEVAKENYAVSSGSTILEFTVDYLNTLAVGEHQVEMTFTDGVACSTLTVKAEEPTTPTEPEATKPTEPADPDNPQTGDSANPLLFAALILVSLAAIAVIFERKRLVK